MKSSVDIRLSFAGTGDAVESGLDIILAMAEACTVGCCAIAVGDVARGHALFRAVCGVRQIRIHNVGRGANGDAPGILSWRGSSMAWTVEKEARVRVARMDKERMLIVVYERGEYRGG